MEDLDVEKLCDSRGVEGVLAPWKGGSSLLPTSLFLLGEAYCFELSPWLLADDAKSVLVVFFCQCSQSVTIVSR